MPRDIQGDEILSWWLRKWEGEFIREVVNTPDAARAVASFPSEQILELMDIINSGIMTGYLLPKYGFELVQIVADHVGAEKYRLTPEQLKKKLKKGKK